MVPNLHQLCFLVTLSIVATEYLYDGFFPLDENGELYHCKNLGYDQLCNDTCAFHNRTYGYCDNCNCYCKMTGNTTIVGNSTTLTVNTYTGFFPLDQNKQVYHCQHLGYDQLCNIMCVYRGGTYGYCAISSCYCETTVVESLTTRTITAYNGFFPLDVNGEVFHCEHLGYDQICNFTCAVNGGTYGYCTFSSCYCEKNGNATAVETSTTRTINTNNGFFPMDKNGKVYKCQRLGYDQLCNRTCAFFDGAYGYCAISSCFCEKVESGIAVERLTIAVERQTTRTITMHNGFFPLDVNGKVFRCEHLGYNKLCNVTCAFHGGTYGYCAISSCYCEKNGNATAVESSATRTINTSSGFFPLDENRKVYKCQRLGYDQLCNATCAFHRGTYGYCAISSCYCKNEEESSTAVESLTTAVESSSTHSITRYNRFFPLDENGQVFHCEHLGYDQLCNFTCASHGGTYGYCAISSCYCEKAINATVDESTTLINDFQTS